MNTPRAPIQGCGNYQLSIGHPARGKLAKPDGTISWEEHLQAHAAYEQRYGKGTQSAERIAARGGFGYAEFIDLVGSEPTTWVPNS